MDDFVGMGGTLANLKGYIESQGGKVLAAVSLTDDEARSRQNGRKLDLVLTSMISWIAEPTPRSRLSPTLPRSAR